MAICCPYRNFEEELIRLEIEGTSAPFNCQKWLRGQQTPSQRPSFLLNTNTNQNFEIAILFNVIERSGNYVFEDDNLPPQPSGQGL